MCGSQKQWQFRSLNGCFPQSVTLGGPRWHLGPKLIVALSSFAGSWSDAPPRNWLAFASVEMPVHDTVLHTMAEQ